MSHVHDHSQNQVPKDFGKAFLIGIALNSIFIICEIIYGFKANSLALLADAGHNASDVIGLFVAWFATILAKRKASKNFTYGLQSATIIAALINAVLLVVASTGIIFEAVQRLTHENSQEVNSVTIIFVALMGIFVNGITAWLFVKGSSKDLNIRGAFLHMAADAMVSLGVVISGVIILKTGALFIDPITSLIIALVILIGTWSLLKDSIKLSLHAVPKEIDSIKVREYLKSLPNVTEIHDLHIWAMSTSDVALSAHLLMSCYPEKNFLKEVEHHLDHHFKIGHSTIQIEVGDSDAKCNLAKTHTH
jgi:cobalt-zinc-cadmium efflux system protein